MSKVAALIYRGDGNIELQMFWQVVKLWQQQGKVAGLLNKLDGNGNKMRDYVCSLTDNREYAIMYDGGCDDTTCKLDLQGLVAASEVIRDTLNQPPKILVFNKFGHAESEGSGLIDEYAQAIAADIPVISLLQDKYVPNWLEFTDGMGQLLNSLDEVLMWAEALPE